MAMISTMKEQVYNTILKRIISLQYLPGQKISEKDLCEELQIGRTPIREAILQLREVGLIVAVPQSGTYVSKINLQKAKDARFMRESVETRVIEEAIEKLSDYDFMILRQIIERQKLEVKTTHNDMRFFEQDENFHHYFYQASGREQVWLWLQMVNMQLNRFRVLRLRSKSLSWDSLVKEHEQILEAVKEKQPAVAVKLLSGHLHRMLDEEPTLRRDYADYFE
ncbi:GntR family transcriptional regulator [Lactobacillus sp. ESL0679]|uniref:GntR family transcriptional regulator n=1 Tax=Lactobacillus sp. ESL0679 TaxID=2983209 RepID=UPI0023F671A5|nr:GntR family transcriptional regulator [Lactobacillus sp. ESL0679]MDF7682412.1 GntR family transcriptional regulator [Lactobacillus sp. ESL0679]